MLALVLIGLGFAALAASEQRCAQVGGHDDMRRQAALRRLPPHLRAQAEANIARRSQAAGIGRIMRPGHASAGQRPDFTRRPQAPGVSCPPLPWLSDEVTDATLFFIDNGLADEAELTREVLREVYPVTEDGRDLTWPARPQDCAALHALQERVRLRVARLLATLQDMEADDHYRD